MKSCGSRVARRRGVRLRPAKTSSPLWALIYPPAFHDEPHVLKHTNVVEWVPRHGHQIGQKPGRNAAPVTNTEQVGRGDRGRSHGINWSHTSRHERPALF